MGFRCFFSNDMLNENRKCLEPSAKKGEKIDQVKAHCEREKNQQMMIKKLKTKKRFERINELIKLDSTIQ